MKLSVHYGMMGVILAVAVVMVMQASLVTAEVIELKSITRTEEAVVLKGTNMTGFYGRAVNSTDSTQSPNELFVWAYDDGIGWRQVVFQIDEVNNTYPNSPGPDYYNCDTNVWVSRGGSGVNYYEDDDGLWDSNDELVFMTCDLGDRVSLDEWAPGASAAYQRYEIRIEDPLNPGQRGWAYVFVHTVLPTWTTESYVDWNETNNFLNARDYTLQYPTTDGFAFYFQNLAINATLGGTGQDLLQQQRWRSSVYFMMFFTNVSRNETQMQTQFAIGCYSNNTKGNSPWKYKNGRVRVSRYYWSCPTNAGTYTGDHPWKPMHVNQYYANYWHENQLMNHSCPTCAAEMNWFRDYLDHTNTLNFNFYTSNGDSVIINGSAETLATTPMWSWSQSSSSAGSFVKLYPLTYMPLDSGNTSQNYYLDTGTIEGEAGYQLNEPQHTSSTRHHFHYFMLPPNAANVGQVYRDYINTPPTMTSTSQVFVIPPLNFDGILSATDVNGPCVDQGVLITWDNVLDWNDGCSSSCTNRRFVISRSGSVVRTEYNVALSSWTDTTGTNNVTYNYNVEACNHVSLCTELGTTLPGMDYVAATPLLADNTTNAVDMDLCVRDGITISWADPSDWRDNNSGSRWFDLYWSDDGYTSPIVTNVISPLHYAVADSASHQYRIRAVNACDLATDYTASAAVADLESSQPVLPVDAQVTVTDLNWCSFSGIEIAWDPVSDWADNGNGTRRYDLYWSRDGFTTPIVADAVSPLTYYPPDSVSTTYRIIATNGCLDTSTYTDGDGADGQVAANFAGVQSVVDTNGCAVSVVTISWTDVDGDGADGWNDGGVGAEQRLYRILRDGIEIAASPVLDGTSSVTDQPPVANTAYSYSVVAYNMQGCYTSGGVSLPGTDYVALTPTATPAQTLAVDIDCNAGNGVTISWDAVTDWGDHGYNEANRRYRIFWSADNYTNPIISVAAGTLSAVHNPPDNIPYRYRVSARNGCSASLTYLVSDAVFDKSSCSPSCTVLIDNSFDPANNFSQICNSRSFWTLTPGVGRDGSMAWQADLSGSGNVDGYACLRLSSAVNIPWLQDVKVRFWSAVNLETDDAGIVEIWTNDSGLWQKVHLLPYPVLEATVPLSIADGSGSCATDALPVTQPAFQGAVAGFYYEARLDSYLTGATTQINIGFRVASGSVDNASTWVIDDVKIGYGIADSVYFWSLSGDQVLGVVKDEVSGIAEFSWEDDGLYQVDEFRLYRSENPADIRGDVTSGIVWTELDTNAMFYTWVSDDDYPDAGGCWFYKIYGYKEPCGESNQGEN